MAEVLGSAAQLAAAYCGERQEETSTILFELRNRVLFGLLDMAGRLEENSTLFPPPSILSAPGRRSCSLPISRPTPWPSFA